MILAYKIDKTKLCIVLTVVFFLCFLKPIGARSEASVLSNFYRANILYEKGSYDEAILEYDSILTKGYESGALYYNLANSYFKKGNLGEAILNYEKAKMFMPRDTDLISNYDYAISLVKFSITQGRSKTFTQLLNRFFDKLTIDEITIVLTIAYFVVVAFIAMHILGTINPKATIAVILFLATLYSLGICHLSSKVKSRDKQGIIISADAQANYEPHDEATLHFNIFEGAQIKVIKCKDFWCKVQRSDNKIGWIPQDSFKRF